MEHEITLTISRVKDEHVAYTVMVLNECSMKLDEDGTDIGTDISVERDHDGVERLAEYMGEAMAAMDARSEIYRRNIDEAREQASGDTL